MWKVSQKLPARFLAADPLPFNNHHSYSSSNSSGINNNTDDCNTTTKNTDNKNSNIDNTRIISNYHIIYSIYHTHNGPKKNIQDSRGSSALRAMAEKGATCMSEQDAGLETYDKLPEALKGKLERYFMGKSKADIQKECAKVERLAEKLAALDVDEIFGKIGGSK